MEHVQLSKKTKAMSVVGGILLALVMIAVFRVFVSDTLACILTVAIVLAVGLILRRKL